MYTFAPHAKSKNAASIGQYTRLTKNDNDSTLFYFRLLSIFFFCLTFFTTPFRLHIYVLPHALFKSGRYKYPITINRNENYLRYILLAIPIYFKSVYFQRNQYILLKRKSGAVSHITSYIRHKRAFDRIRP